MHRDTSWQEDAACRDPNLDPSIFFPVAYDRHRQARAIHACRSCEVRVECLTYAMLENIDHGTWGGFSERKRRKLRRHWAARGFHGLPSLIRAAIRQDMQHLEEATVQITRQSTTGVGSRR